MKSETRPEDSFEYYSYIYIMWMAFYESIIVQMTDQKDEIDLYHWIHDPLVIMTYTLVQS